MEIAQKSTLAKLLATENITVEHQKVSTAMFDLKSRKIILPIWNEMSNDLYDMLIGHEVGHALFTPLEGWHDQVSDKGPGFKGFLNVVEDARIERMMKAKFPGLVKNFYKGYQKLFADDFFGVRNRDVDSLPLIDRINLHYKIGNMLGLTFTAEEQVYLDRIDQAKGWDDVMAIANDLYGYAQEESEMEDQLQDFNFADDWEDEDEEDYQAGPGEVDDSEEQEESEETEQSFGSGGDLEEDADEEVDEQDAENTPGKSLGGLEPEEPKSITDEAFRENEDRLVNETARDILYAKFPKMNISKIVKPLNEVWDTEFDGVFKKSYFGDEYIAWETIADKAYVDFNRKNTAYINALVQQFEMKRKASQFAKARQNKTGKLNVDKLWATRLTEDVFLSNTVVPEGKNHGMMMFVDFSGSMHCDITATLEQILIQVSFCKKVNIPFDVYSFTGQSWGFGGSDEAKIRKAVLHGGNQQGLLMLDEAELLLNHLISSSLSASQYKKTFRKMLTLAQIYNPEVGRDRHSDMYTCRYSIPEHLQTGGTPLAETALVARDMIKEFRNKHGVEVMNTIFLTDGDPTGKLTINNEGYRGLNRSVGAINITEGPVTTSYPINRYHQYEGQVWYGAVLKHIKNTVDTNLINLHIGSFKRRDLQSMVWENTNLQDVNFEEKYKKEWIANKFFEIENHKQFDVFYAIKNGSNLKVDDGELEVKSDSKGDLKRGFVKFQKNKGASRVFLNKFIDRVA